ncbi:uncharacterized protein [Atheta coriaria]|uniref:uncharacterized protein n=1 Tax=Dalotia coriaria TaxID=877792 RepID=UPI0031F44505
MLFYVVTISCVLALASAGKDDCKPTWTCHDAEHYEILGLNSTCNPGTVCNQDYTDECNPCVELNADTCQFTCDPANMGQATVTISNNDVTVNCNEGQKCNILYLNDCSPCIAETCDPVWKCNPDKETEVSVSGVTINCRDRKVCNKDYKYPCDMCVDKFPGITYPPNCNDGHGHSNPCRPGPIGSRKYYTCKKVGKFYFDYEEKKCLWQFLDGTCKKNKEICT